MNKLGSRELYQIQICEKYKKLTSQLYYEGYFNNFDFDWKSFTIYGNCRTVKLGSRELYQIQICEKYKKPTSQLYYEGYFSNFDFEWKSIYLLPRMVTVDTKLRVFQYKILNNILFVNKMLFKLSSKLKMKLI